MKDYIGDRFTTVQKKNQKLMARDSSEVCVSCGDTNCSFHFQAYKYVPEGKRQDTECVPRTESWHIANPFTLCCTSPNNDS